MAKESPPAGEVVPTVPSVALRAPASGAGWIPPALLAGGWVLWAYLRSRPPTTLAGVHIANRLYENWAYSHFAYTDVISLYRVHHLADHAAPYFHTTIEYPVLTGLFMWTAAWAGDLERYFAVSAAALAVSALCAVYFLYRSAPRRAWAFASTPLLLVYSLLNWDVFAIALMLGGWHFFRQKRYLLSGVLLSLAVSAKFFPAVLLVYLALSLVADRAERDARVGLVRLLGAAGVTWVVLNAPFAIANPKAWGDFYSFNASRGGGGGVLYEFRIVSGWPIAAVDALSAALVLGLFVLVALPVLRRGSPEAAAAIAFAGFMLVNKTFSPQYMLWVLAFAIIADWPVWTFAMLAGAGLVDFANAMIILHLAAAHDPAYGWYRHGFYEVNRAIRLGSIGVALVVALFQGRLRTREGAPLTAGPVAAADAAAGFA